MTSLLEALRSTLHTLQQATDEYGPLDLKPRPGASAAALSRLATHLGAPVPPSWKALLQASDGGAHLAWPGRLLSIAEIVEPGPTREAWLAFQRRAAKWGDEVSQRGFPLAQGASSNEWVIADLSTPTKAGECAIVEWAPDSTEAFDTVAAWLKECLLTARAAVPKRTKKPKRA